MNFVPEERLPTIDDVGPVSGRKSPSSLDATEDGLEFSIGLVREMLSQVLRHLATILS